MPDNKEEKTELTEEQKKKNEADTKKVADFLAEQKLEIVSQMSLVLANGDSVPIRGLVSQAFVVRPEKKEEDGLDRQKRPDSVKSQD